MKSRNHFFLFTGNFDLMSTTQWLLGGGGGSLNFSMWGSVPIFGVQNPTLNQCLGSTNNNERKTQYLGSTNLKKGIFVLVPCR